MNPILQKKKNKKKKPVKKPKKNEEEDMLAIEDDKSKYSNNVSYVNINFNDKIYKRPIYKESNIKIKDEWLQYRSSYINVIFDISGPNSNFLFIRLKIPPNQTLAEETSNNSFRVQLISGQVKCISGTSRNKLNNSFILTKTRDTIFYPPGHYFDITNISSDEKSDALLTMSIVIKG